MDEKNGVDVSEEQVAQDNGNLQPEDDAVSAAAVDASSDKPAADPDSASDNSDAALNQEEKSALLNQEDMVDDTPDDANPGGSGLLSQEEIDNALQQENVEDDSAAGGDGVLEGGQEEVNASANNAAPDGLDVTDFQPTGQRHVKEADFQQLSSSDKGGQPRNIDLLMDVELPVSIELGHTKMDISDILSLGPGSIVELDKLVGEPVDLLVNYKRVARGEVVVVEENFGLRITQLVSPEERIKNLQ